MCISIVKRLLDAIKRPFRIVESVTRLDSFVIITKLFDENGRVVIISLLLDEGYILVIDVNNIIKNKNLTTNVMTGAYGRNIFKLWMKRNELEDRIIYDINKKIIKKRIDDEWTQITVNINS